MSSSSRAATIVALALTTTFLLSSSTAASTPTLCQTSDYPTLCAKIARSVNPLTLESLTEACINAAAAKAIHSRAAAARLAYSTHDRTMQNHLSACRSAYTDALGSLRAAGTLMKTSKDNREAIISDISAAMRSVKTCEDNFREAPGMAFPLRRVNNSLMKMVKNSLAIGSQLK